MCTRPNVFTYNLESRTLTTLPSPIVLKNNVFAKFKDIIPVLICNIAYLLQVNNFIFFLILGEYIYNLNSGISRLTHFQNDSVNCKEHNL